MGEFLEPLEILSELGAEKTAPSLLEKSELNKNNTSFLKRLNNYQTNNNSGNGGGSLFTNLARDQLNQIGIQTDDIKGIISIFEDVFQIYYYIGFFILLIMFVYYLLMLYFFAFANDNKTENVASELPIFNKYGLILICVLGILTVIFLIGIMIYVFVKDHHKYFVKDVSKNILKVLIIVSYIFLFFLSLILVIYFFAIRGIGVIESFISLFELDFSSLGSSVISFFEGWLGLFLTSFFLFTNGVAVVFFVLDLILHTSVVQNL